MKNTILFILLIVFGFHIQAATYPVQIDIPAYDYPFNSNDYFSMRQSVAVSNSFLQTAHYLIGGDEKESEGALWKYGVIAVFDYMTAAVPVGSGWAHEEWHRAVMTRRKIGSYNDMNRFPWGQGIIAVSHESDQDFIDLKKHHPAEQVRMSSAGMEAQVYQNMKIEESHFFKGATSRDIPMLILNTLNVSSYMMTCASTDADKETQKQMEEEGANIAPRDFTGLDCNGWVYDLFRPDEPYQARGPHPSGVGLKRYITFSDLNQKEKDFLKLQTNLSYLNFVDPFLLGFNDFHSDIAGKDVRWNFKLSHYITSFGGTVDANLFAEIDHRKFLFTLHNGMTDTRYLPGLTLKWVDLEIDEKFLVTLGATLWQQPRDQRVENPEQTTLIHGSAELTYKIADRWDYYIGADYKNAGWIAGNVYLEDAHQIWTGLRVGMF